MALNFRVPDPNVLLHLIVYGMVEQLYEHHVENTLHKYPRYAKIKQAPSLKRYSQYHGRVRYRDSQCFQK